MAKKTTNDRNVETRNAADNAGLVALKDAHGYEVADDNPDVRGWKVFGLNDQKLGKVDELLVDIPARKVRYLVLKLDDDIAGKEDRRVLVPVGLARLDRDDDRVLLPEMTADRITTLPVYSGKRLTRAEEDRLRQGWTGQPVRTEEGRDYYAHQDFDEDRFYRGEDRLEGDRERHIPIAEEELAIGKRRVQAGEVDIDKHVETEHVSKQVPVTREEVEIERRAVDPAQPAPGDLGENHIRIPLTEEEVVVEKRPIVREEVVVRKHAVDDTREVADDVRRERVDIDKKGDRVEGRIDERDRPERR